MIAPATSSPQPKILQYRPDPSEIPPATIPSSAPSTPPPSKTYIIPSYNHHQIHPHLDHPVNLPPIAGEYPHSNLPLAYPYHPPPATYSQPSPAVNNHPQKQNGEYHSPVPIYPAHIPRHAYPPSFGHAVYHHPGSKLPVAGPDGGVPLGISAPTAGDHPHLHPHHLINDGLALPGVVHNHASAPTPASRRLAHIQSEQKRRESINCGFDDLKRAVPSTHSSDSKAVVLKKAVQYVQQLQSELERLYEHTGIEPPMYRTFSPLQNDHHHYADYGEYRSQRQPYYAAPMYRPHSRAHPDPGSNNHSPEGSVSPSESSSRRMLPIGPGLIPQSGPIHSQALHHHPGHTIPPPEHDTNTTEPISHNPHYKQVPSSFSTVQEQQHCSSTPHGNYQPSGLPISGSGTQQNSKPTQQSQAPSEQQKLYPTDAHQSQMQDEPYCRDTNFSPP